MNTTHRFLVTAALMAVLTGSGLAQTRPDPQDQRTAHMASKHQRTADRQGQHLNALKAKLQLQSGQDAAWAAFVQAMQPSAQATAHPDPMALAKLTTPERIDQMQAFKALIDAHMQKRADATKALYAELSADQKKTFDQETARFMTRHMAQGMGHGHAMHH